MDFEIPFEKINKILRKRKIKKALIQLPEGLKPIFQEIKKNLVCECVLSGDSCFGACDLRFSKDCDATIHIGHNSFGFEELENKKTIFCEVLAKNVSFSGLSSSNLPKKVGLLSSLDFLEYLPKVKRILEEKEIKCYDGGQILGCNWTNALKIKDKVDCFLVLSSGIFHALGVQYATKKPVFNYNPFSERLEKIEKDFEKEKWTRIALGKKAKSFGIVLSSKPGQYKIKVAEKLLNMIKEKGLEAELIVLDDIFPERLNYLPFDAFVITACPRIVIDDWKNYQKAIILPDELNIILGDKYG
ncbi:MAG: diphthamide biosynthesis enzyme Dph2 [archaeon]